MSGETHPSELEGLWTQVHQLARDLVSASDHDTFLDDCLDRIVELLGAHKGLIVLTDRNGATQAVNARGQGRALTPIEREEVSRTILSKVQTLGRPLLWEPDVATPSGVAFGIAAAIAAPIMQIGKKGAKRNIRGVLYLDFRDVRKRITAHHQSFVETSANLIAVILELSDKLYTTREDLRSALVARPGGPTLPTLEEILRPPSMAALRRELGTAVNSEQPIVITGESGTGKTLLARAIAAASARTPFVRATLGQSDDLNTISSELFGHLAGAFSGALGARTGLVEFADGGVLLLDEILNLPLAAQQLLLDFTQFGSYRPLGYSAAEPKYARVRIICATNGSLEEAVKSGRFREDLYYRLASIKVEVPALRTRRADIPSLVESHLRRRDPGRAWAMTPETRRLLVSPELPWRGNVRQLEASIERAVDRALAASRDAEAIAPEHFEPRDLGVDALPGSAEWPRQEGPAAAGVQARADSRLDLADADWQHVSELRERLEERERAIFVAVLEKCGGVVAKAARELGMSRTSLVSRLNTHKIEHGRS